MAQGGGQAGGIGSSPMGGQMQGLGSAPMGGQMQGLGSAPMGGQMQGLGSAPMGGGFGGGQGPYGPGMQPQLSPYNTTTQQDIMGGQGPYGPGMQPQLSPYNTTTQQDIMGQPNFAAAMDESRGGRGAMGMSMPQVEQLRMQMGQQAQLAQQKVLSQIPAFAQMQALQGQLQGRQPSPQELQQLQAYDRQIQSDPSFRNLQQNLDQMGSRFDQQYGFGGMGGQMQGLGPAPMGGQGGGQGLMQALSGLGFQMTNGIPQMPTPFTQQGQPQVAQRATAQPQPPATPKPQMARQIPQPQMARQIPQPQMARQIPQPQMARQIQQSRQQRRSAGLQMASGGIASLHRR